MMELRFRSDRRISGFGEGEGAEGNPIVGCGLCPPQARSEWPALGTGTSLYLQGVSDHEWPISNERIRETSSGQAPEGINLITRDALVVLNHQNLYQDRGLQA